MRGEFSTRLGSVRRRGENSPPIRHADPLQDTPLTKNPPPYQKSPPLQINLLTQYKHFITIFPLLHQKQSKFNPPISNNPIIHKKTPKK